jgi:hypothetical protein
MLSDRGQGIGYAIYPFGQEGGYAGEPAMRPYLER